MGINAGYVKRMQYGDDNAYVMLYFLSSMEFCRLVLYKAFRHGVQEAGSAYGISFGGMQQDLESARVSAIIQYGGDSAVEFVCRQRNNEAVLSLLEEAYGRCLRELESGYGIIPGENRSASVHREVFDGAGNSGSCFSIVTQAVYHGNIEYDKQSTSLCGEPDGGGVFDKTFLCRCGCFMCGEIQPVYEAVRCVVAKALSSSVLSAASLFKEMTQFDGADKALYECLNAVLISGIDMRGSQTFSDILRKAVSK